MNDVQFGICCEPEITEIYADAGFDYFECSISAVFQGGKSDAEATGYAERLAKAALPCRTGNGFIPAAYRITGPEVDRAANREYSERVIRRAAECGLETMVFGSGGARRCPDGFSMETAALQVQTFLEDMIPALEKYGMTIAIEPLNTAECNILLSVAAGAVLTARIGHPRIRLLADSYHFLKTDLSLDSLTWSMPLVRHVHLGTVPNRLAPGQEECDGLKTFLAVLKHGGYRGRMSIESGHGPDLRKDARESIAYLRETWASIE